MIYGYARVSTDYQSLGAQIEALTAAGCGKVFQEKASGALKRAISQFGQGDVLIVTRLDRLAHSTRDLLNRQLKKIATVKKQMKTTAFIADVKKLEGKLGGLEGQMRQLRAFPHLTVRSRSITSDFATKPMASEPRSRFEVRIRPFPRLGEVLP